MDAKVKLPIILLLLIHHFHPNFSIVRYSQEKWYERIKALTSKNRAEIKSDGKCPLKCICYEEFSVRCMFLRLRRVPRVQRSTRKL